MPRVEFEPTILEFGKAKTFHALDRAATVIGTPIIWTGCKINHAFAGMGNKEAKGSVMLEFQNIIYRVLCIQGQLYAYLYNFSLSKRRMIIIGQYRNKFSYLSHLICNLYHYVAASTILNYMPISFNADSKTIRWKNIQVWHKKRQIVEDPKEILVDVFCVRQTIRTYTDLNAS
jgi:hypothetical protein